jgi:hypothetical protein
VPVYSFVAETLSSLPEEPHPTNLLERNVTQNFASLDLHASYALFSSVISTTFVGPAEAVLSGVSSVFALFASTFPPHVAKMKAAAAVRPKCTILAIIAASKLVVN